MGNGKFTPKFQMSAAVAIDNTRALELINLSALLLHSAKGADAINAESIMKILKVLKADCVSSAMIDIFLESDIDFDAAISAMSSTAVAAAPAAGASAAQPAAAEEKAKEEEVAAEASETVSE